MQKKIMDSIADRTLFRFIFMDVQDEKKRDYFKCICELNKSNKINVLSFYLDYISDSKGNHEKYIADNFLKSYLEIAEVSKAEIIGLCKSVSSLTGSSGLGHDFLHAVKQWFSCNVDEVPDIILAVIESDVDINKLLLPVFQTLAKESTGDYYNQLLHLIDIDSESIKDILLGSILYAPKLSEGVRLPSELIEYLMNSIGGDADPALKFKSLYCLTALIRIDFSIKDSVFYVIKNNLHIDNKESNIYATNVIVNDILSEFIDIKNFIIQYIVGIKCFDDGLIRSLDLAIWMLIRKKDYNNVIKILNGVFSSQENNVDLSHFESAKYSLVECKELYSKLLSMWLLSGNISLLKSSVILCEAIPANKISLCFDYVNSFEMEVKYVFLARKIIGWMFYHPRKTTKLVLDVYQHCALSEKNNVIESLYKVMLTNFPGVVGDYLHELNKLILTDEVKNVVEKGLSLISDMQGGIKKAYEINELRCSQSEIESFFRKQNREISKVYEDARESSLLSTFFGDPLMILYGESSIVYRYGVGGESTRHEIPMYSQTFSHEHPSLLVKDPVGFEMTLFDYKFHGVTL